MKNLQLDHRLSAGELARQILAEADRSTPFDFRSTGLGPLLEGADEERNFEKYIGIFQLVSSGTNEPLVRLRAKAEVLGALRRHPDNDVREVLTQLSQLEQDIVQQEHLTPEEANFLSGISYNRGISYRSPRDYLMAAHAQDLSAVWTLASAGPVIAQGNPCFERTLSAIFIGAVERSTHALINGDGFELEEHFFQLRTLRRVIRVASKTLQIAFPAWVAENGDRHTWSLHLWGRFDYPEREADESSILARPANDVNGWSDCVRISQLIKQGQHIEAVVAANQAEQKISKVISSSASNTLLTAQLLKARTLVLSGATQEGKRTYSKIIRLKVKDGGGPKVAARRELASLKKA